MADESDHEKTEEPSEYRLQEARKKGEVASSKELASVLILFGVLMTLIFSALYILEVMHNFVQWLYMQDAQAIYAPKMLNKIMIKTMLTAFKCVTPVFISAFCLSILAHVMQIGLLYAPEALSVKFERINPLSGAKRLFAMRSIVEVIKGVFKFAIIMGIAYVILGDHIKSFTGFLHVDVLQSFLYSKTLIGKLAFSILTGLAVVALGDFAWQKYSFRKKMMMTKQQVKEEMKEKDGSPEIKQRIRQVQREQAQKRMMEAVESADVIVTNPTHISVAIKYDAEKMIAPAVVAKGQEFLALRIREMAKKHDIPLVENVPLARTLYKTVKIGEGVPRTLYKAVAEILAFVYKLKRKKKALS